jgi:hypothetical protein
MRRSLKLAFLYIIFTSSAAQAYHLSGYGQSDFNLNPAVEVLSCSLRIARWHNGKFFKVIADIQGQRVYLGRSNDINEIQPLLWFPNLKDSELRHLGVFASLTVDPLTGKELIDVGFYKAKTIFSEREMPRKAWRTTETSSRYMVPVFTKTVSGLDKIEISYEDDIEPLNLNITGNLNHKYIDLRCEHIETLMQ